MNCSEIWQYIGGAHGLCGACYSSFDSFLEPFDHTDAGSTAKMPSLSHRSIYSGNSRWAGGIDIKGRAEKGAGRESDSCVG